LHERLALGHIAGTQQVRTGMGTMLGSVAEVLAAGAVTWNPADSTSGTMSAGQTRGRNRTISLVVLALTVVPALLLATLLGGGGMVGPPTPPAAAGPVRSVIVPPPPLATRQPEPDVAKPVAPAPAKPVASVPAPPTPAPLAPAPLPPATVAPVTTLPAGGDGVVILRAEQAELVGTRARVIGRGTPQSCIGEWNGTGLARWRIQIARPGRYRVQTSYACNSSGAGGTYQVAVGGTRLSASLHDSGSWSTFATQTVGEATFAAGEVTIEVSPLKIRSVFMKLHTGILTPLP
jgi:hypothetical protein